MITCILLAAGESRRFGAPKPLAEINGQVIIERLQRQLVESSVGEVIVVLGAHHESITSSILNHIKVKSVYNKDYKMGQTSSFQAGLREVGPDCEAVLLLPVDFPLLTAQIIDGLIDFFRKEKPFILIPTYKNQKGHPPVFDISAKKEIVTLDPALGLNEFEHRHADRIRLYPVASRAVVTTFNTPEQLRQIQQHING